MEYTNRTGDVYYFFEGRTKTGKPRYFASRKPESSAGERISELPDSFEITEHPESSVVTVRIKPPTNIRDDELQFVIEQCRALSKAPEILADRNGNQITIHAQESGREFLQPMGGFNPWESAVFQKSQPFSPACRLILKNQKTRIFRTERYCFRGGIEGWVPLPYEGTLERLAEELFPGIGDESFYDLL